MRRIDMEVTETARQEDSTVVDWLTVLLLILASFRLTHLIVFDSITDPLRNAVRDRPLLGPLLHCYWCTGIWTSATLVLGLLWWPSAARPLVLVLAVAGGQAVLEHLVRE